jgi:hypothetical protein
MFWQGPNKGRLAPPISFAVSREPVALRFNQPAALDLTGVGKRPATAVRPIQAFPA